MLVLRAAGLPQKLGSHNLLASLVRKQQGDGSFGTLNHTAFGVLALRAAGRSTRSKEVRAAVHVLLRAQNTDGGFGFARHAASDVDDTGAVLQALAAGGHRSSPVVTRAVAYLRKAQRPDGGFAQMATGDSNAQSTAFAVQGLVAARRSPDKFKRARTPIGYLKSLQASDGSVRYSRTSSQTPVWVTAEVLVALERKPYPLAPAPRQKAHTASPAAATSTSTMATPSAHTAAAPKLRQKLAHRRHTNTARVAAKPQSNAVQVKVRPVAQTTTQTSTTAPDASTGSGGKNWWPYVFAVLLALVMLIGIRLAWRRA
jgi:hypothetical protein